MTFIDEKNTLYDHKHTLILRVEVKKILETLKIIDYFYFVILRSFYLNIVV